MTKIMNFLKLAIACITCFTVQINSASAQWPPAGIVGNGTAASPWEITTIQHLMALAAYVNNGNGSSTATKHYKLMNDIAYNFVPSSTKGWSPIGNNVTDGATFQGNFDGNGKKVTNIAINRDAASYVGLFGHVSSAYIHDLGVEISQMFIGGQYVGITGNQYVGGLIGRADNSTIENCYVIGTGNITGTSDVGGLVGFSFSSVIRNSYAICDVSGSVVGGFVGANNGTIIDCYATGNITGTSYTGGFVGSNKVGGSIAYCYATGDVSTTGSYVGGLAGENQSGTAIRNCVAAGIYFVRITTDIEVATKKIVKQ